MTSRLVSRSALAVALILLVHGTIGAVLGSGTAAPAALKADVQRAKDATDRFAVWLDASSSTTTGTPEAIAHARAGAVSYRRLV